MPHPSYPADDFRARSYNREHGRFRGLEDVWIVSSAPLRGGRKREPASRAYV